MRVDIDGAEQIQIELGNREKELLKEIRTETGVTVEPWAAASVAKAFDALGLNTIGQKILMLRPLQSSFLAIILTPSRRRL